MAKGVRTNALGDLRLFYCFPNRLLHMGFVEMVTLALPGDREKFLDAGMDDFLGKPVSLEDFQRVFNKFFGEKEIHT